MVIEALKAARDFIENDRQALAESLTVNGEIVFEDDIDRGAMAEYVNVLGVIDKALESTQAQESPFQIGQRLRQEGRGISDLWGAVGSDADMPEAQRGFDEVMRLAPVQPVAWLYPEGLEALQKGKCWTAYPTKHDGCNIPLCVPPAAQPAAPEGWKLVPVKPTPEMLGAGVADLGLRGYDRALIVAAIECYGAMLAAAPEKGGV
jgi:hypothetical protein